MWHYDSLYYTVNKENQINRLSRRKNSNIAEKNRFTRRRSGTHEYRFIAKVVHSSALALLSSPIRRTHQRRFFNPFRLSTSLHQNQYFNRSKTTECLSSSLFLLSSFTCYTNMCSTSDDFRQVELQR